MREFSEGMRRVESRSEQKQRRALDGLDQEGKWEIQDDLFQPIQANPGSKEPIIKELKMFFQNSGVEIDEAQIEDSYSIFNEDLTMHKQEVKEEIRDNSVREDELMNEELKNSCDIVVSSEKAANEYLANRIKIGNRFVNDAQFESFVAKYREGKPIVRIAGEYSLPLRPLSFLLKTVDAVESRGKEAPVKIGDKYVSREDYEIIKNERIAGNTTSKIAHKYDLNSFSLENMFNNENIQPDERHAIKIGQQFISIKDFKQIVMRRASGEPVARIADDFGVSEKNLYNFLKDRISSTKLRLSSQCIKIGEKRVDQGVFEQIKMRLLDGASLGSVASEYGLVRQRLAKVLENDNSDTSVIKIGYKFIRVKGAEKIRKMFVEGVPITTLANDFKLDKGSLGLFLMKCGNEAESSDDLLSLKVKRDVGIIYSKQADIAKRIKEGEGLISISRELNINGDVLLVALKWDKKNNFKSNPIKKTIKIGHSEYVMELIDEMVRKRLDGETVQDLARLYKNEYEALDLFFKSINIKPNRINRKDIVDFLDHFHPGSELISYLNDGDNSATKMVVRCDRNHIFPSTTNMLLNNGVWCNECYREGVCVTLDDICLFLARYRQGSSLLSTEIEKNADSKVKIRCPKGHVYEKVIKKIWTSQCTECNLGFQERACKIVFDAIFSESFTSHKHFDWLVNVRGNKMHLDGYLKFMGQKIAFEYQGRQHREYLSIYYRSYEEFEKRLNDDVEKARLCEIHGVKLIVVPDTVNINDMADFVIETCKKMKIKLTEKIRRLTRDEIETMVYDSFYSEQTSLLDFLE